MHPAKELVAQIHPPRGKQDAREVAAFFVGQIVSLVHAFPLNGQGYAQAMTHF
jgi:hypothetical protein